MKMYLNDFCAPESSTYRTPMQTLVTVRDEPKRLTAELTARAPDGLAPDLGCSMRIVIRTDYSRRHRFLASFLAVSLRRTTDDR